MKSDTRSLPNEQVPPVGDDAYDGDTGRASASKPPKAKHRARQSEPSKASLENAGSIPGLITPERATEQHKEFSKLPTVEMGFPALDALLDGLRPTQPYVLAAATGQGKTSFMLQLVSQYQGPVLIWTREMEPWQLQGRMVSQLSGSDSNAILRGKMPDSEYAVHVESFRYRLWYFRGSSLQHFEQAVQHVAAAAQKRACNLPLLVVIDYLQKIGNSTDRLREAISEASEMLRRVTQQYRLVTWIVSAVGRNAARRIREQRDLPPGDLVDVGRESGSIEYDAAALLVLGLEPENADDERKAVISIAKNRYGRTGQVEYLFNGETGAFRELGQLESKAKRERRGLREKILEAVGNANAPLSTREIRAGVSARKQTVLQEIASMVVNSELERSGKGFVLGRNAGDDELEPGDEPGGTA